MKPASKPAAKPAPKPASKPAPAKKDAKPAEKAPAKAPLAKAPPPAPAKKPEPAKAPAPAAKSPTPLAPGAKPAPTGGKEGITIKTPMKKVPPPPPKNIPAALLPKSKGGSNAGPPPTAAASTATDKTRFRNPFQTDFSDGKAAAAKLFAAAGLTGLKHTKAPTIEDEMAAKPLTKTPLNKTQLKEFRDMLIAKRSEAAGDVQSMEAEALGGGSGSLSNLPQHMAEQGTDTFDQSMALSMAASKRTILRDIDAALQRIEDSTYGICEMLGKPIEIARLQAEPWTRYSIEGARHKERMSMMR
ncbi:MAG: TraR/DksA family transcriptional regulator [Phycisphaerales bacterium]